MKFKKFLQEAKEKHAVLAFGRMNPPTTGHAKLVDKVKDVASEHNASHHVVLSGTQDKYKNPLSVAEKVKHAKRFFPNTNVVAATKDSPTFLAQAEKLHKQGVTHLHMVAGSDRLPEYQKLLHRYNGDHEGALFHFKKITLHSAGERDPDAEGTEGMSASKMRSHAQEGNFKEFSKGIPAHMKPEHAKELYHDVRNRMGMKESFDDSFEMLLSEGVHDASIFKAVFLAGGPGSGKDYVLDNTLAGHGLTEINSDRALEFLMDKEGLDKRMPNSEEDKRNLVRGRAKTITDLRQRLALLGRNGLIINGTGDDIEKTKKIKARLEELGYDTKMLLVNTRDDISAQRNIERGQRGGRAVPETIRKEKWDSVQNSRTEYAKLFGTNYIEFDNSEDLRSADPEVVKQKKMELMDIFKNVREFTQAPPKSEPAELWIASELDRKDRFTTTPKQAELSAHADGQGAAADQAHQLGLSYYGFGRYGKQGKVTHHTVNGKLVEVPREKPGEVSVPTTGSSMKKKVNESMLSEAVSVTFSADTIEELNNAFSMFGVEGEVKEEVKPSLSNTNSLDALTLGTYAPPIQEASYPGNIGMMEVMKFHQKATPEQKKQFKLHMANNKHGDAWKLIQDVSGVKLVGKEFESNDKYITDKNGNPRMFMLRRAAAKEAHLNNGEVVQQGRGYVVKLKENKNDEIFQGTIESQTTSARTSLTEAYSSSRPSEDTRTSGGSTSTGSRTTSVATSSYSQLNEHCGCEVEPTKKITLSKIRERQAKKVEESIDKGIEPGLSMAASGESIGRDMGEKIKKKTGKASQVVEMQGDETGASIGAQKEDELKKKGISLLSFKSNKAIGA